MFAYNYPLNYHYFFLLLAYEYGNRTLPLLPRTILLETQVGHISAISELLSKRHLKCLKCLITGKILPFQSKVPSSQLMTFLTSIYRESSMMWECFDKGILCKIKVYISINRNLIYYSLPDLLRQVKIADRPIILEHQPEKY